MNSRKDWRRRWMAWVLLLSANVLILYLAEWWHWDDSVSDYWVSARAKERTPDPRILLLEIDDKSLTELEPELGKWPWPRSVHAYLLEAIMQHQPKRVGFDVLFAEKDVFRPADDAFFAETVARYDNLVLASLYTRYQQQGRTYQKEDLPRDLLVSAEQGQGPWNFILPTVTHSQRWHTGLINLHLDNDGVLRHFAPAPVYQGARFRSLAHTMVKTPPLEQLPDKLRLNFIGDSLVPHQSLSFVDAFRLAMAPSQTDKMQALFAGKFVLIGATASGLHDLKPTPISPQYPGLSVLATAMDNLLNQDYYHNLSKANTFIPVALLVLALMVLYYRAANFRDYMQWSVSIVLLAAVAMLTLAWMLSAQLYLLPVATATFLLVFNAVILNLGKGFSEFLKRRHAIATFSRFLDPKVVTTLVEHDDWETILESRSCKVTVLFSDIRGFTSLSESRSAEQVLALLNQYFDTQVKAVFHHHGTLDKFIGDALMAFWGAPLDDDQQEVRALAAAKDMEQNLAHFKAGLPKALQGFDIGIGIHTGTAVVGMLGSQQRIDYTAIGDTVNLASRIEGLTKEHGRILISEDSLSGMPQTQYSFEFAGAFTVKGRQQKVRLYRPT